MSDQSLKITGLCEPAEPLWKRVPARDEDGRLLSDFLMLIPRLSRRPPTVLQSILGEIQHTLAAYRELVVFADLNLRLNLLWVSVKPMPGLILEMSAAVKLRVPEAILIANRAEAILASRGGRW